MAADVTGLTRALGSTQLALIALGGAIGTGLFLGAGFAIGFAGPAVLVSYAIGAGLALLLMGALAEMTIACPLPGAFGAQAEAHLGRFAGFIVRAAYLIGIVLAVGTEVAAVAAYMAYWWPAVPGPWWVLGFSAAIVACNAADVRVFGALESVFALVKIAAIVVFLLLGTALVFGTPAGRTAAAAHYNASGFLPHGWSGVWVGTMAALFSFFGLEIVAVAAGEAADPAHAIVAAFRASFARLAVFYLAAIALILALVPWTAAGVGGSPFVIVMAATGIPYAGGAVNFVILVAALSSMNGLLYVASRMLFSLALAGQAPAALGRVTPRGVPRNALGASCGGIALAVLLTALDPRGAFATMMAAATFMPLFTWGMIFATHLAFRRTRPAPAAFRFPGFPWTSRAGVVLVAALLASMPFTAAFRWTVPVGLAVLVALAIVWRLMPRASVGATEGVERPA